MSALRWTHNMHYCGCKLSSFFLLIPLSCRILFSLLMRGNKCDRFETLNTMCRMVSFHALEHFFSEIGPKANIASVFIIAADTPARQSSLHTALHTGSVRGAAQ